MHTESLTTDSYFDFFFLIYILKLADKVFPYILYIFIVRTRMSAR